MINKPKHKIYHEVNFYLGLLCFILMFSQSEVQYQFILFIGFVANIGAAQGLCNKHNIEDLYKEKNDESK